MNQKSVLAVGLLACLAGCASSVEPRAAAAATPGMAYSVFVDPAIDANMAFNIASSGNAWMEAIPGFVVTTTVAACPIAPKEGDVCFGVGSNSIAPNTDDAWATTVRDAGNDSSQVTLHVTGAASNADLGYVTLHALGHAFGLGHTGGWTAMAVSEETASPFVNDADVEQFLRLRAGRNK